MYILDKRKSRSKKAISLVAVFLLLGLFLAFPAHAQARPVQITVDGKKVDFDVQPYIDSQNRTIVPLRLISEKLGFRVGWSGATKEVTVLGDKITIKLWAGQKNALVNSQQVTLDTIAVVSRGRIMVPLRFILENLGATVHYNEKKRAVNIFLKGVPPEEKEVETEPKTQSLQDKTIVVDPGHGKIQPGGWPDPGAVGPTGLQEKDVVLDIGQRVVQKLKAKGANVFITRTGNTTLTLADRAALANNNKADVFVSIHMNANLNRAYNGTAVYYYNGNQGALNKKLAELLQTHLVKSLGLKNIGIIAEQFAVLRYTHIPAALVETAFISNPDEEKLAYTDAFREKAAQGIVAGIEAFLIK